MAVSEKTEEHRKDKHNGARNVRGRAVISGLTAHCGNNERKRGGREQHAAGIDADAANPLLEVVTVRLENKPLISEKRKRDREQVRAQTGDDVAVGDKRSQ